MSSETTILQPTLPATSKSASVTVLAMEPAALAGLVKTVGDVVNTCWSVGTALFGVQRELSEVDEPLEQLGEEVKGLRSVLDAFHGCLRKVAARQPDEEEYQMVWDATDGVVKDCERYFGRFVELLAKVRGEEGPEDDIQPQLLLFRLRLHRSDLDKARIQLQGHKYNLYICLTMLVTYASESQCGQERQLTHSSDTSAPTSPRRTARPRNRGPASCPLPARSSKRPSRSRPCRRSVTRSSPAMSSG